MSNKLTSVRTRLGDNYVKIESYRDNILIEIEYLRKNHGVLTYHRDDGPAHEEFYPDGSLKSQSWYKYGRYHRIGGPAFISMYEGGEGKICREVWYRYGEPGRSDGAPYYQEWSRDGKLISKNRDRLSIICLTYERA